MTTALACSVRGQNVVCARAPPPLVSFALLSMSHRFTTSSPSSWSLLPLRQPLRQLSSPCAHGRTVADRGFNGVRPLLLCTLGPPHPVRFCSSSVASLVAFPCSPVLAACRQSLGRTCPAAPEPIPLAPAISSHPPEPVEHTSSLASLPAPSPASRSSSRSSCPSHGRRARHRPPPKFGQCSLFLSIPPPPSPSPHSGDPPPHLSFSPEPLWTRLLGVGRRPVSASSRRRGLGPLPALQLLQAGAALRPAPASAFTLVGGDRSWPGRRWPRCCLALPLLCVRVGEEGEGARREEREGEDKAGPTRQPHSVDPARSSMDK
ncbi:uncharacterized protein [Aegilops tauschii subsp. strangulata]|uniref:uncharacterized protein n=1 Tax=Aegilops tauschii subsp. strangulata TaxID=200361 RepID=UPI001ABCFDED